MGLELRMQCPGVFDIAPVYLDNNGDGLYRHGYGNESLGFGNSQRWEVWTDDERAQVTCPVREDGLAFTGGQVSIMPEHIHEQVNITLCLRRSSVVIFPAGTVYTHDGIRYGIMAVHVTHMTQEAVNAKKATLTPQPAPIDPAI